MKFSILSIIYYWAFIIFENKITRDLIMYHCGDNIAQFSTIRIGIYSKSNMTDYDPGVGLHLS